MATSFDTRETADLLGAAPTRRSVARSGVWCGLVAPSAACRAASSPRNSGTSERYLAQIESGAGNPSVLVMRAIADALEIPLFELLPQTGGVAAPYARIVDLLGRVPPHELPAIADVIERRIVGTIASDRGRRIALVGLRGGGKSTLGKLLADKLGVPFIELDRMVEQRVRRQHAAADRDVGARHLPAARTCVPRARYRRERGAR